MIAPGWLAAIAVVLVFTLAAFGGGGPGIVGDSEGLHPWLASAAIVVIIGVAIGVTLK